MSILSAAHFHDEQAAYDFVEARLWATGRVCPKCGVIGQSGKLSGKSTRIGVCKCYACRKPFTVKVGTVFESSHLPLRLWLQAIFLIASSKKGISTNRSFRPSRQASRLVDLSAALRGRSLFYPLGTAKPISPIFSHRGWEGFFLKKLTKE